MSLLTLEAKLERVDPSTQWGFRMQGGQDFSAPLTIQRVLPGSLAAKCGLQQGDIILKIGNSDANIMKHKDAQGAIMGSGNKLDLLLQRKNLEQYMEDESTSADQGAPPHQYQYEKFSAPAIPNKAGGLIQYDTPSSNYNVSARPYGAPAPPTQSSTFQSQLNTMAQQTQNIALTPKPAVADFQTAAQRYTEREDKPSSASQQSKSFKTLQEAIDSGQDPPSALLPIQTTNPPVDRRSPSPIQPGVSTIGTPILNSSHVAQFNNITQFNSPAGLYNSDSANSSIRAQRTAAPPPPAPPAPKPAPAPAPAPVPWASSAPKAAASTPKAFVPKVQPKSAPPRPTGTGAVRGKKGDVTVYQEGQPLPGGARVPICSTCGNTIRGPFVVAMHKTWCPDHFVCAQAHCGVKLLDIGFVEEGGFLYCEKDYETYFAPKCSVCSQAIVGECVNALQKTYHPDCFTCHQCKQAIGGNQFHLEDGHAYCEHDWKQMFQTMCKGCAFPIEPGDRWVEAMSSNYHSECFNCSTCQVSLEGQPFYAKAGKPYCKKHAR